MNEELEVELVPEGQVEDPIYPSQPDVPLPERRRAWCVVTACEMAAPQGKPLEWAETMVRMAAIVERYLDDGSVPRARPQAVEKT